MLKAAQKKGIPTLIQEQNSYAGVTNKLLAKGATSICVAYEGMERFFPAGKIMLTGNPVRADILSCELTQEQAKEKLGFDPQRRLVLVVGGSLGARTINNSIADALEEITASGASVLWQTGKFYIEDCALKAAGHKNVKATAFISEMNIAYRAADIIVSRAGASTISELQLIGLPAILVPSPNVAEDHQRKNAQALVNKNAAVMLLDSECHDNITNAVISLLDDEAGRIKMSENLKAMALPDADKIIADKIHNILRELL